MKKIILFIIILSTTMTVAGPANGEGKSKKELRRQRINAIIRQEEEGVIKYRKHLAFGVKLTSDGYGGFIEVAQAQSSGRLAVPT